MSLYCGVLTFRFLKINIEAKYDIATTITEIAPNPAALTMLHSLDIHDHTISRSDLVTKPPLGEHIQ